MKSTVLVALLQSTCLAQGIITTVVGNDAIFQDDGKPALSAALIGPTGMALDSTGNLFVASPSLNMVLKVNTRDGDFGAAADRGAEFAGRRVHTERHRPRRGHRGPRGAGRTQSVVGSGNPAHSGDALVIYCDGLGDVDPRQIAGSETPFMPLSQTLETVTVTIGGVDAPVFFAGLTPGFTGLYQVNAFVPAGMAPGDNVPLVITQSGRSSPAVMISIR
jgi:hypothetical protein